MAHVERLLYFSNRIQSNQCTIECPATANRPMKASFHNTECTTVFTWSVWSNLHFSPSHIFFALSIHCPHARFAKHLKYDKGYTIRLMKNTFYRIRCVRVAQIDKVIPAQAEPVYAPYNFINPREKPWMVDYYVVVVIVMFLWIGWRKRWITEHVYARPSDRNNHRNDARDSIVFK